MHERTILERALEDREQKLVEACNEIAFWKTAAQRALEIMTAREDVQEELRERTLEACRWLKLWALEDTLAWAVADALEKDLRSEEAPPCAE
jgi:hypothetical protein